MKWGEFKMAVEREGVKDEDNIRVIDAGYFDDFDSVKCVDAIEGEWEIYGT